MAETKSSSYSGTNAPDNSHIEKNEDCCKKEIDCHGVMVQLLLRVLDDFGTLNPRKGEKNRRWFEGAKNWLFGEPMPLLSGDGRYLNFTIEDVADFFSGSVDRIRRVALFMRRYHLTVRQFARIYWSELGDEDTDFEAGTVFGGDEGGFGIFEKEEQRPASTSRVRAYSARKGRTTYRYKVRVRCLARSHINRNVG